MLRRTFLAVAVMSAAGFNAMMPASADVPFVDYRPGVLEDALASGKTVLVDYSAVWCTTCRAQKRVLARLTAENPAYAKEITFVLVDWDEYGDQPVARDRSIPRRSTLVLLRGNNELGRIVAGTSDTEIRALLDKGL